MSQSKAFGTSSYVFGTGSRTVTWKTMRPIKTVQIMQTHITQRKSDLIKTGNDVYDLSTLVGKLSSMGYWDEKKVERELGNIAKYLKLFSYQLVSYNINGRCVRSTEPLYVVNMDTIKAGPRIHLSGGQIISVKKFAKKLNDKRIIITKMKFDRKTMNFGK